MERHFNISSNGNQDVRSIAAEADWHDWLRGMHRKINKLPTLLSETAGEDSCSIYRVPQSLVEINEKAYKPRIVSIGPYHYGQEHLRMIQERKWRFLRALLTRKEDDGSILSHCFQIIASVEMEIRGCYSDQTSCQISSHEFVEMMVLDGSFIIELVCKFTDLVDKDTNDPIFKMDWVIPFLMRDLLKLENQIPFFVLQYLFDILVPSSRTRFAHLALKFFSYMLERPASVLEGADNFHGAHLLDLVRLSFRPSVQERPRDRTREALLGFIHPAEKLHRAGIRFKIRSKTDSFLDLNSVTVFSESQLCQWTISSALSSSIVLLLNNVMAVAPSSSQITPLSWAVSFTHPAMQAFSVTTKSFKIVSEVMKKLLASLVPLERT